MSAVSVDLGATVHVREPLFAWLFFPLPHQAQRRQANTVSRRISPLPSLRSHIRPDALSCLQPADLAVRPLLCECSNNLGGDVKEEDGRDEREGQDNDDERVAGVSKWSFPPASQKEPSSCSLRSCLSLLPIRRLSRPPALILLLTDSFLIAGLPPFVPRPRILRLLHLHYFVHATHTDSHFQPRFARIRVQLQHGVCRPTRSGSSSRRRSRRSGCSASTVSSRAPFRSTRVPLPRPPTSLLPRPPLLRRSLRLRLS